MSARSRALRDLAEHLEHLRDEHQRDFGTAASPVYNGYELWDHAADMTRRTADDETWRSRAVRLPEVLRRRARTAARRVQGTRVSYATKDVA